LAAARVNAELSQREVAKMLKVGKQTILNWEKGKVAIPAQLRTSELCSKSSCFYKQEY
jgi:toxin-antitoxin system, antitoxin component, xre family